MDKVQNRGEGWDVDRFRQLPQSALRSVCAVSINPQYIVETFSRLDRVRSVEFKSDNDVWQNIVGKIYYANVRSYIIDKRLPSIINYLGDINALQSSDWDVNDARTGVMAQKFLGDESVFRAKPRLIAVVNNARKLRADMAQSGSRLLDLFLKPGENPFEINVLKNVHQRLQNLERVGVAAAFHVMTDLGFPVVKPDRVLIKLSVRLGLISQYNHKRRGVVRLPADMNGSEAAKLINDVNFVWEMQDAFLHLSHLTGISSRALDWILVKLGQLPNREDGIEKVACDDKNPDCFQCGLNSVCARGLRTS